VHRQTDGQMAYIRRTLGPYIKVNMHQCCRWMVPNSQQVQQVQQQIGSTRGTSNQQLEAMSQES